MCLRLALEPRQWTFLCCLKLLSTVMSFSHRSCKRYYDFKRSWVRKGLARSYQE